MVTETKKRTKHGDERGLYVVLAALTAAVGVMLLALVIDTGRIFSSNLQLRNAAGFAAKRAVKAFAETSGTYQARELAALDAANEVYQENFLLGNPGYVHEPLGIASAPADGGEMILGFWAADDEYCGTPPCPVICSQYPCFVPETSGGPGSQINAARVVARTAPGQGIAGMFSNIFGVSSFNLEEEQTAKIVSRCTHLLLDLSSSLVSQTHLPLPMHPQTGLYAVPQHFVTNQATVCAGPTTPEELSWCNMGNIRGVDCATSGPTSRVHCKSDFTYSVTTSTGQIYYLDSFRASPIYDGPEPLRTVLLGLNRAVFSLMNQSIRGDLVGMVAFDSQTNANRFIPLSDRLDLILQITNMENLETFNELGDVTSPVAPNSGTRELYPKVNAFTNIIGAIDTAILDFDNNCPAEAVKNIVLVSDGIMNCYDFMGGIPGNATGCAANDACMTHVGQNASTGYNSYCNGTRYNGYDYPRYWYENGWYRPQRQPDMLKNRGIRLNMLAVGDHAGVHTRDVARPSAGPNEIPFYTVEDLIGMGRWREAVFGRSWSTNWNQLQNGTSGSPLQPGYQPFRDAMDLWYTVVVQTGGKWAPLRPQPNSSDCVEFPVGSGSYVYNFALRSHGTPLYVDPLCRTLEEQATEYALNIIGTLPNVLVARPTVF